MYINNNNKKTKTKQINKQGNASEHFQSNLIDYRLQSLDYCPLFTFTIVYKKNCSQKKSVLRFCENSLLNDCVLENPPPLQKIYLSQKNPPNNYFQKIPPRGKKLPPTKTTQSFNPKITPRQLPNGKLTLRNCYIYNVPPVPILPPPSPSQNSKIICILLRTKTRIRGRI